MHQSAVRPAVIEAAITAVARSEADRMHTQDNPLRTASGFVLGTVLSVAMWTAVGALAWYLI